MHPHSHTMALAARSSLGANRGRAAARTSQPGVGIDNSTRSSRCSSPARYWSMAALSSSGNCVC